MARFRYRGAGWEVCDPVNALGRQVELAWPDGHPTDGTLASSSHTKWPLSDHGKDPNGIVRAIDVGVTPDQGVILTEQLRATRDMRLRYVIHNRRIFSSYPHSTGPAWTWRPYSGSNPHVTHIHVSMQRNPDVDNDIRPFDIDLGGPNLITVEQLQTVLNAAGRTDPDGNPLEVDGIYGAKTEHAWITALTADEFADHDHPDLAPVEWTKDRIAEATRNSIEYGDTIKTRRPPP